MMELPEKIEKLRQRQDEDIQKAREEIATIKAEYEKAGYNTGRFALKETEVIESIKDYYVIVLNQMVNKPDLSEYENMANELERLLNKKRELLFKMAYPLSKRKEYRRSA